MNTEQTKKCRECQTDIPKKARRCPNCRTKQGIGLGGLLVAIIFIGITTSVVMSSVNDSSTSTNTYTAPVVTSNFELGTYRVESEDLQYIDPAVVNIWQSYSDRTKVGELVAGDIVEVTRHDSVNDYCKVAAEEQIGWVACGWLVKN